MARKDYAVFVEGLFDGLIEDLDNLDENATKNLVIAVNDTLRFGQKLARQEMESQVNFPHGYLTGDGGRLRIEQFASKSDMLGIIRGKDRPTSLARFVSGAKAGQRGVNVSVTPGVSKPFKTAFVMRLRGNNLGLAIRTKDKKAPGSAYKPKEIAPGLWLLYGPSVDQVFNETRDIIKPELEEHLKNKFTSLMERDT